MSKKLTKLEFEEWCSNEKVENYSDKKYIHSAFSATAFALIITASNFSVSHPNLSDKIELVIIISLLCITVNGFFTFCYSSKKLLSKFLYWIGYNKKKANLIVACGLLFTLGSLFSFLHLLSDKVATYGYIFLLVFLSLVGLISSFYRRKFGNY